MIIPVVWTNYTATVRGRVVKLVPCEGCSAEYVYLLEREGQGAGTSAYFLNEQGAADHAVTAAEDTLRQYLANDFDPVPCPVCGHYQRHMHPKLYQPAGWLQLSRLAAVVAVCVAAVGALLGTANVLLGWGAQAVGQLVAAWVAVAAFGGLIWWLSGLERGRARRFDPNVGDPRSRIALGRQRAVTRAAFEVGIPPAADPA